MAQPNFPIVTYFLNFFTCISKSPLFRKNWFCLKWTKSSNLSLNNPTFAVYYCLKSRKLKKKKITKVTTRRIKFRKIYQIKVIDCQIKKNREIEILPFKLRLIIKLKILLEKRLFQFLKFFSSFCFTTKRNEQIKPESRLVAHYPHS